jgi:hypothetical protein
MPQVYLYLCMCIIPALLPKAAAASVVKIFVHYIMFSFKLEKGVYHIMFCFQLQKEVYHLSLIS